MSEQPNSEPQEGAEQETPQEGEQQQTFDADYVAKLRKETAKYRTEAKANADAAKKLAEIEEAQKTESEKAADRIAKAEAEVEALPAKVAEALRDHLVQYHAIDKDDAELFLTGDTPELLLKQASRWLAGQSDNRKSGTNAPVEGRTSNQPPPDDRRAFADFLTGNS